MKITFDVWENQKGEIHLTSEDIRLSKGINIRAKEKLESTRVLRQLLDEEKENLRHANQEDQDRIEEALNNLGTLLAEGIRTLKGDRD